LGNFNYNTHAPAIATEDARRYNSRMTYVVAAMLGLGGPEVAAIFILSLILFGGPIFAIVMVVSRAKRRTGFSRYCPKCGRGLTQQVDAPFCSYCGQRLP